MTAGRATTTTSNMPTSHGQVFGKKAFGRDVRHESDDAAHEPGHRAVGQRDQEFDHEQRDEQRFGLAGKVPEERDQPGRRFRMFGRFGRLQEVFEET